MDDIGNLTFSEIRKKYEDFDFAAYQRAFIAGYQRGYNGLPPETIIEWWRQLGFDRGYCRGTDAMLGCN